MKKFLVVSGFLGAGKTTTMTALSRCLEAKSITNRVIANDLGAKNLVDARFTEEQGVPVEEITGGCICFQTENLVDKLRRFMDYEHADFVMSDIPGCGVGALELVYHKLNEDYHGEFQLAPFLVVTDPDRLRSIMPEKADLHLPPEMEYLLRAQLMEADVVVLNKIDLLRAGEQERFLAFLRETCPGVPVFPISAREEQGIGPLADFLLENDASLRNPDIGFDDEIEIAEAALCWYNRQFYVSSESDFDGNGFCLALLENIRKKLTAAGRNVPHLKLFAREDENDSCKLSLLGVDYEIQQDKLLGGSVKSLSVILNARAACEAPLLSALMDAALAEEQLRLSLHCQIFFTECFGMMDEGRED